MGIGGVEQKDKGLAQFLQLAYYPFLCLNVIRTGNVGDGAVGGDHHTDGGVVRDDLGDDLTGLHQVVAHRFQLQGAAPGLEDQRVVDHEAAVGQHVALCT